MEPAIDIVEYLWDARNTWLRHDEDCDCPPEFLIKSFLREIVGLGLWAEVVIVDFKPELQLFRMTSSEWDEVCGPRAQKLALQGLVDQHMGQVSELMALQATWDRLAPENG